MPASEEDRLDTNEYPFLSLMMTISHIACYSRLELKFPLSQLRKYQHNPGLEHWKGLLVIAAYLKKHPNLRLKIAGDKNSPISVFGDSTSADCIDSGRTTGAYWLGFFGTPISLHSSIMKFADTGKASTSTQKAEVKIAVKAAEKLDEVINYLEELGVAEMMDENGNKLFNFKKQAYGGLGKDTVCKHFVDYTVYDGLKGIPHYCDNRAVVGGINGTDKSTGLASVRMDVKVRPRPRHPMYEKHLSTKDVHLPASIRGGIGFLKESSEHKDINFLWCSDTDQLIDVGTKTGYTAKSFMKATMRILGHEPPNFEHSINSMITRWKSVTKKKPHKKRNSYKTEQDAPYIPNEFKEDQITKKKVTFDVEVNKESISDRIKARHKGRTKLNYTNNMEAESIASISDSDGDDDGTAAYRYLYMNSADEGEYEYNDY